ncbi:MULTISPECIES: hypothetical protein [unclassified Pseudonocardia]|uniref:DUF6924 domain-containing protein n=1 Tax=unclassified Pseudonocardia TaxID=2619320 RepID=UPI0011151F92|nr:hypothetical protein [Pseudonocardia sp. Ae707_Ps1]
MARDEHSVIAMRGASGDMTIPEAVGVPVIRTAFSAPERWHDVVRKLSEPVGEEEFLGNFSPLSDEGFDGASVEDLVSDLGEDRRSSLRIIIVFDSETEDSPDLPLLAVDLRKQGELTRFRVTPEAVHLFEMNIAISNMDFVEYARWAQQHGGLHSGF